MARSCCRVAAAAAAVLLSLAAFTPSACLAAPIDDSLSALLTVDKEGQGHAAAQRAMHVVATARAADLPKILQALDHASPLSANWLRNAFESVADRELRARRPLPTPQLEAYVRDRSHPPRARRLAFDWLVKVDRSAEGRLIPGMLLDPAPEFRREAVALRIAAAANVDPKADRAKAIALYREALSGAIHDDQVKAIAKALEGLGQKVDLVEHFAFLTRFSVIGPFDNQKGAGLDTVYPPEKEVRLDATYAGKLGVVSWKPLKSTHEYGIVDIARQVKPYKSATMYALAEFDSPAERRVELRLATQNAWKIWLNGQYLFSRNEYHRGSTFDQYRVAARMRAGRNTILLKICQDDEKEDWAQSYQFQLRVCDANGSGVRSRTDSVTVSGGRQ